MHWARLSPVSSMIAEFEVKHSAEPRAWVNSKNASQTLMEPPLFSQGDQRLDHSSKEGAAVASACGAGEGGEAVAAAALLSSPAVVRLRLTGSGAASGVSGGAGDWAAAPLAGSCLLKSSREETTGRDGRSG